MNIRYATNVDRAKIIRLVKATLNELGFKYAPDTSESDLQNIDKEYKMQGGVFLIMEDDKQELIATGALKKEGVGIFKIRKMYVRLADQKKGYGREILIKLLELARSKGATTVVLETSNLMISAQQLYRSFGFVETDQQPASPRCDITMVKKLK